MPSANGARATPARVGVRDAFKKPLNATIQSSHFTHDFGGWLDTHRCQTRRLHNLACLLTLRIPHSLSNCTHDQIVRLRVSECRHEVLFELVSSQSLGNQV